MIDLETYSTKPNAIILTIGAIKFDNSDTIDSLENMDTFYRRIDILSCSNLDMNIEKETEIWWSEQPYAVKYEALINPDRVSLKSALIDLINWIGNTKYIWSQGTDFDIVILKNAFDKCKLPVPWKFWNVRDSRTIISLCNKKITKNNQHHHALYDCYNQICALKQSFRCINNNI